jgi:hypothetical protein
MSKSKSKGKGKDAVMVVWSLRMPPSVIAAVKRHAKTERVTATDIVREALGLALQHGAYGREVAKRLAAARAGRS